MLRALSPETIREAKRRSRRDTCVLLTLLVFAYVAVFALLFTVVSLVTLPFAILYTDYTAYSVDITSSGTAPTLAGYVEAGLWVIAVAVGLAVTHFVVVRRKPLERVLAELHAERIDTEDRFHWRFKNVVEEAEAATGIRPIRPVVLPTTGYNSFAVADGEGRAAIGITEGFLARLSRAELLAVVAHEAAHLVHGDSRVATTACSLVGVFDKMRRGLAALINVSLGADGEYRSQRPPAMFIALKWVFWIFATLSYLLTKVISVAISRKREFLADAHAVEMCREPIALAEALYKAKGKYHGVPGVSKRFASMFLFNLRHEKIDDKNDTLSALFSTHPPIEERLSRLLRWARADASSLRGHEEGEPAEAAPVPAEPGPRFLVRHEDEWKGPFTASAILAQPFFHPALWVCEQGTQDLARAESVAAFATALGKTPVEEPVANRCPRCHVPLAETNYEGAPVHTCSSCKGFLLRDGVLERLIARRGETFSESEVDIAVAWRERQGGLPQALCDFPEIACPGCGTVAGKGFYSWLTHVVIDRCLDERCRAIWLDTGELERIQILVEQQSTVEV